VIKAKLSTLLFCVLVATILSPVLSLAGDLKNVTEDFQPIDGTIVKSFEGKYLIDLDASQGLHVGDLFAVIVPGEKVVHPISKEVIGALNKVKAVLRVTLIQSGFSYAERLYGKDDISKGESVRRFSKLTAAFYSSSQGSDEVYQRLRTLLPELDWQGHFRTQPNNLPEPEFNMLFVLSGAELKVVDQDGRLLQIYAAAAGQTRGQATFQSKTPDITTSQSVQKKTVAAIQSKSAQKTTSSVKNLEWQSPGIDFGDLNKLGELPFRTLMASFHKVQENLFVATVDGSQVRIHNVTANMQAAGEARVRDGAAAPIMTSWWQPAPDGPTYLAVTASLDIEKDLGKNLETKLSGVIFKWHNSTLTPVMTGVPYFLVSYDLDGDGVPETLLGQEFDLDRTFGRTYKLSLGSQGLSKTEPPLPLPDRFILPGSNVADLNQDGQPELITISNRGLSIFSNGSEVYTSTEEKGGSLASISYDQNPGLEGSLFKTASLEIQPVVSDVDGDGILELLLVSSDTSTLKAPGIGPGIEKSWITALKYTDGGYRKGVLKFERENPLQGLWAEKGKSIIVETMTLATFNLEGRTNFYLYSLDEATR